MPPPVSIQSEDSPQSLHGGSDREGSELLYEEVRLSSITENFTVTDVVHSPVEEGLLAATTTSGLIDVVDVPSLSKGRNDWDALTSNVAAVL